VLCPLISGGQIPMLGEVSLAHHSILYRQSRERYQSQCFRGLRYTGDGREGLGHDRVAPHEEGDTPGRLSPCRRTRRWGRRTRVPCGGLLCDGGVPQASRSDAVGGQAAKGHDHRSRVVIGPEAHHLART
jgi:hypothetical protein